MNKREINCHEYEVFGDLVLASEMENMPFEGVLFIADRAPSARSNTGWAATGRGHEFQIHLHEEKWILVEI